MAGPTARVCTGSALLVGSRCGPFLEAGLERLLDQEGEEAGAIDEEIALDPFAGSHRQRGDEAGLGMLIDTRGSRPRSASPPAASLSAAW